MNASAGRPWIKNGLELAYPARAVSRARLGNIPFLFWIVEATKPRLIVELGVGTGNSYCAFLQAACQLKLDTRCFGVDPWDDGDSEEAHRDFCGYHDPLYGAFSTLLRSSYNAAASQFGDGTIDLLHIGGTRDSNTGSDDLKAWLPKMSARGIALVHGTNAKAEHSGARQAWDSLWTRYPAFDFTHSDGLGIAYIGDEPLAGSLKELFDRTSGSNLDQIRAYFARLGRSIEEHAALRDAESRIATVERASRTDNAPSWRQQMALVARLQREVAVLNRHKLQSEQIIQSTSWRVTAPLRWLVSNLRLLRVKSRG